MNFKEAIDELNNGKAVRRPSWGYIFLKKDENVIKSYIKEPVNFNYDLTIIESNDWVLVSSPDKTMDFYKAIEHLKNHELLKLKHWPDSSYILSFANNSLLFFSIKECDFKPLFECFISIDWEICG